MLDPSAPRPGPPRPAPDRPAEIPPAAPELVRAVPVHPPPPKRRRLPVAFLKAIRRKKKG